MEREEIHMSEDEYEILDELYFVTAYEDLVGVIREELHLFTILKDLHAKGYIKYLREPDTEWDGDRLPSEEETKKLFFLATKEGLLAHNSK